MMLIEAISVHVTTWTRITRWPIVISGTRRTKLTMTGADTSAVVGIGVAAVIA